MSTGFEQPHRPITRENKIIIFLVSFIINLLYVYNISEIGHYPILDNDLQLL